MASFARTHAHADPGVVMGFYNGASLPVYDHLARTFCLCDHWFSSVDGATWPNRLYALTGRAAGSKDNRAIPVYSIPSFVRQLEAHGASWNSYSHDISTLRLTDPRFRLGHFERFRYFQHPTRPSFLKDAADGTLPAVSWIDPDFSDLGFTGNDDHPPADIKKGQELVLKAVHAVTAGPLWLKTMLVVLYDEHGGLFDHVIPGPAEDDSATFRRYGVRVPAFVVSPWVEPGHPSHEVFDHTSVIKTILVRFCRDQRGRIPNMGRRVTMANHLGTLLTRTAPQVAVDLSYVVDTVAAWQPAKFKSELRTFQPEGAGVPREASELQTGLALARKKLEKLGLPPGQL